jgi:hypothetical protein
MKTEGVGINFTAINSSFRDLTRLLNTCLIKQEIALSPLWKFIERDIAAQWGRKRKHYLLLIY